MAIYPKLLLSAGGGIISAQQQAEQAQNTASILIGLGGTGVDCLRTIKTQVYSRLKPDDPNAVVAVYSHIRFLGVDSAEKTKGNARIENENTKADALLALDDTEFFSISNSNVNKAFSNSYALKTRPELDWLRWEDIPTPDLGKAGAGGIRQIGRYMMMDKSEQFLNRIEQEINTAKSGLSDPPVNIHIFSGLSGGTGAGCFLDVCYMVRSIANKVGGVTIFGYFFLPDVNLSKVPYTDTKTRAFIPKNGYASMQELDYCMQFQYNGGSFTQEYQGHRKIEWNIEPVDMCHLICATNSSGDVIPNAYNYAMNVTAEYLMDFLTYSDKVFDLSEQLSNFRQKVRTADGEKVIGTNLAYCVIGASCASIPMREINTYLASELFERFAIVKQNIPNKSDVEKFAIASLGRDAQYITGIYDSLYREARENANGEYALYTNDWKYVRDNGNGELFLHYTNQTSKQLNTIEVNTKSMISVNNQNSLLMRVHIQMLDIIKDIQRGPSFAYRLISAAESNNLLNIIDGLIEENSARWNEEAAQSKLRNDNYTKAKADFEHRHRRSLLDSDEKRFSDYEKYLMILEQHELTMNVYIKLDNILREFRKQIVEFTASYYIRLNRVMETLIQTFKENHDALTNEKSIQTEGSFMIPLMTITELRKFLDAEIENINITGMLNSFMTLLLDHSNDWITEDENKISKLVTTFFVENAFQGFANRTITSFLKDKYGLENDGLLAERIYQDCLKKLTAKASPLFYFNGNIWRESQTSKLAFLSIPATSAPIKAAARKMYEANTLWETKESALTDRIYVMCSACALPLCAYNNCDEYERVCFSTTEPGRHCYEGKGMKSMKFNDWSKLPSLTPQSILQLENMPYIMKEYVENAQKLYDRAEAANIFDEQNYICRPDEESINSIQEYINICKILAEKPDISKEIDYVLKVLKNLDVALNIRMVRTIYSMQNDGYAEKKETKLSVRKDHFVFSPVYHKIVKDILEQIESIKEEAENIKKILHYKIKEIESNEKNFDDYCEALFTGVIVIEGKVVMYYQTNDGITEDITLSKYGDEFEYKEIPVYQGYITYKNMDTEIKKEIKGIVDERHNTNAEEIQETILQLKENFSDNHINSLVRLADAKYTMNYGNIVEFLRKLKKNFDIFYSNNMI